MLDCSLLKTLGCWVLGFGFWSIRFSPEPKTQHPTPSSHDRFALARAGDLHLVAVLRDGAARQLDALPDENLDDLVVRYGVVRVLFLDELLDAELDDAGRDLLALLVQHALGEEAPKLDDALRRVRVLAVDDARDRGEVHPRVLGHVLEHHRLDVLHAVV